MTTRWRIFGFGASALLVVAGVAGAISVSGTLGQVLAFVLISLGLVLATSLVFFEVGLSEDRERARSARPPPRPLRSERGSSGPPRRRLDRMRGRPRRLR